MLLSNSTKKKKHGMQSIDVVPILWVYCKKGKLYCKYPSENEYNRLDEMSKTSALPEVLWRKFGITLIKEAST